MQEGRVKFPQKLHIAHVVNKGVVPNPQTAPYSSSGETGGPMEYMTRALKGRGKGSNGAPQTAPTVFGLVVVSRIRPSRERKVAGNEARTILKYCRGLPLFGGSD